MHFFAGRLADQMFSLPKNRNQIKGNFQDEFFRENRRKDEIKFDRTYLEYVFAEHKEFSFDFENEKLIPHVKPKIRLMVVSPGVGFCFKIGKNSLKG
jgi:hypothetical protein